MRAVYDDLTIPAPGSNTAREVLSRALARLPADLRALPADLPATPSAREALRAVQDLVARATAAPRAPLAGALVAALRLPTAGALVRCLRDEARAHRRGPRADALATELAATVALEIAREGALDASVTIDRPPPRVLCQGARVAVTVPADCDALRVDPEGIALRRDGRWADGRAYLSEADAAPWRAVQGPIALALADNNPLAIYGALPGDAPNAVDLGGRPVTAWLATLREALDLVAEHLPDLRAEMDLHVQQFVPIGHDPETHRSASYRQALGTVYLTLHPGLMTMTEAVIHEFQHNKLHALMEVDPVITNDPSARFPSPLRRDARPLRGVLLAVHAFLPVARLYEAMTAAGHPLAVRPSFRERAARVRAVNRDAAEVVLSRANPTPTGRALLDEIQRWIVHFG